MYACAWHFAWWFITLSDLFYATIKSKFLWVFASSSSPRWGADECRLMILGVGGICQKSYLLLLPPSNLVGVCPLWLRRLGHLLSIWFFLPRLLTPRRVSPQVEWMLSFLWVLFGSFWRLHALPTNCANFCSWSVMAPVGGISAIVVRSIQLLLLEILCC